MYIYIYIYITLIIIIIIVIIIIDVYIYIYIYTCIDRYPWDTQASESAWGTEASPSQPRQAVCRLGKSQWVDPTG